AGEVIYRTNPHSLRQLSAVFDDMLTVGSSGISDEDGSTDANAIVLHDSESDISALFNWMTKLGHQPLSIEEWISVLKLSNKYLIKKARVDSIRRSAIALVDTPFSHLFPSDYSILPAAILWWISLAAWETTKMRLNLFNNPPTIHHVEACTSPDCGEQWPEFWAKASRILTLCQNDVWVPATQVLDALERAEIPGFRAECKTTTLGWLRSNRSLHPEDRIKDETVRNILWFCDVKEPDFSNDPAPRSSGLGVGSGPSADVEVNHQWT
ncbi:hypothetical protein FS837_007299, partial [Tulasnella sp. UAMH 9824]